MVSATTQIISPILEKGLIRKKFFLLFPPKVHCALGGGRISHLGKKIRAYKPKKRGEKEEKKGERRKKREREKRRKKEMKKGEKRRKSSNFQVV